MRAVLNSSLPDTAVIQAGTVTDDIGGGGTLTWAAAGTVDCRVSPIRSVADTEDLLAGRITSDSNWVLTFAADANVDTENRVVTGGNTYEVNAVLAPRSWELSTRTIATKVT
jgi:hypothetical protein